MKIITQKEIDAIMKTMTELNIPVQTFIAMQELFNKLPEQNDNTTKTETAKSNK